MRKGRVLSGRLRLAALFLPAFGFMAILFSKSLCAVAVGRLRPVTAARLWGKEEYGRPVTAEKKRGFANPFRGFLFKKDDDGGFFPREEPGEGYRVQDEFFPCAESDLVIKKDSCHVKNVTKIPMDTVKNYMLSPLTLGVEKNSPLPQILIMHTHATESYLPPAGEAFDPRYSFRSLDLSRNMTSVGRVMAEKLNRLGYNTLQDKTLHDYPSYNGSYDASKATVEKYLEKYPSIKIVLDVHRDAVERDGKIISPCVELGGVKFAQVMIISGADNGYMGMPDWPENLKFASRLQNRMEKKYPGLARPVLFDYRNYNQQLTHGSILIEVGSHGATLSMAKNSRIAVAECLARALDEYR